ncbi:Major facilitator superfamily domain-containing protein 8, partial [Halocaridina rubra]
GAFLLTVFMFIVGNALYAILSVFGYAARAVMVFSRFLVGVSSANIAIIRSYVASSTTTQERTTAVSLTSAAQGLGFIIGPAIQTGLAVVFSKSRILDNQREGPAPHARSETGRIL